MPTWSDATISRFAAKGEETLAVENNLILTRSFLSIVAGTDTYDIPSTCYNITQITWKGKVINARSGHEMVVSGTAPSGLSQSEPVEAVISYIGQKKIRFIPTPNETISAGSDPWTIGDISTRVILEYYRVPSTGVEIPSDFRRYFIKDFVLAMCYAQDGLGQDIEMANYFMEKFQKHRGIVSRIVRQLFHSKRSNSIPGRMLPPRRAQLPWNFERR